MAPELFQKRSYDEKVDVFAFGAFLWELVANQVPFDGLEPVDIKAKVEKEEQLKMPYGVDPKIAQLISSCRFANPADRPSFDKIADIMSAIAK